LAALNVILQWIVRQCDLKDDGKIAVDNGIKLAVGVAKEPHLATQFPGEQVHHFFGIDNEL